MVMSIVHQNSQHNETEKKSRHSADDIFKCVFVKEFEWISIKFAGTYSQGSN